MALAGKDSRIMGFTMNAGGPLATAILRGLYQAAGSGAAVFLITWASTDELKGPLIAGGVAALAALGFRGGVEGTFDRRRNDAGDVRQSDVTPN